MKDQCGRILQLLEEARGSWVPLPRILDLKISQYSARILELRRKGHVIENRNLWIDGQRRSWFRLLPSQGAPAGASVNG